LQNCEVTDVDITQPLDSDLEDVLHTQIIAAPESFRRSQFDEEYVEWNVRTILHDLSN
jgi:hypothetical protein